MSKISSIYDGMVTRLETIFPTHKKMTNPYDIQDNNERILSQAFGLRVDSASNLNITQSCHISINRTFTVLLSREMISMEHDIQSKDTAIKSLLEDFFLLIKDFEKNVPIENLGTVVYLSDSGIQSTLGDNWRGIYLEVNFGVQYFENIGG